MLTAYLVFMDSKIYFVMRFCSGACLILYTALRYIVVIGNALFALTIL